jgi:hypothetical protein
MAKSAPLGHLADVSQPTTDKDLTCQRKIFLSTVTFLG